MDSTKEGFDEFARTHKAGFCKMPSGFSHLPVLTASKNFMVPSRVDCRDYFTPTEDQGDLPWCSAYAAAQWTENIRWRTKDCPEDVDPGWIYAFAKEVDGDPDSKGTTLTAVLEAVRSKYFDDNCSVKTIRPTRLAVKYALHKFGCILCGFNITSDWYSATKEDDIIHGTGESLGGHAVCAAGYDKNYLYIVNSWGAKWARYGHARVSWEVFDRQFLYGAVLSNALDGMTV